MMATTVELQRKLQEKLRELFQLDQPDLDFGFYRVVHAKAQEIADYLDHKLPQVIADSFKDSSGTAVGALEQAYHAAVQQAISFGAPNPEATEPVKKAKKAWEDAKSSGAAEADVYDHLYHFFERYYDHGDFVSLRYLTRETDKHAKPYAIPYAGEEVMLHWANADQYYIKTSENFSHFSVDVTQHPVFRKMDAMQKMALGFPDKPLKLHFKIVEADEGEHGNVKDAKDRFFILHADEPCAMKEDGFHVNFEYRADPDMQGKAAKWQEELRKKAAETIRRWTDGGHAGRVTLPAIDNGGGAEGRGTRPACPPEYAKFLFFEYEVGEKHEKQTILASYLKRYMARNTEDYFIHKDLGGFLRRELDFYIKNEMMILDDMTAATPETVAKWLGKTKVFRTIALDIIAFLAQLEDFQKKLWLKKKFVVQCDYCLTMDRVPEEMRAEVFANAAQMAEWAKLGFPTDPEGKGDALVGPAIDARIVDTKFFSEAFKQRLLAALDDFDAKCDGVLVHSENSNALSLMNEKLLDSVDAVYNDPPYNTSENGFIYKNEYRNSSWASMVDSVIEGCMRVTRGDAVMATAIDDFEQPLLANLLDCHYGPENRLGTLVVEIKPSGRTNDAFLATSHEYILFYAKNALSCAINFFPLTEEEKKEYAESDDQGSFKWRDFLRTGGYSTPQERPNSFYSIYYNPKTNSISLSDSEGAVKILPIDSEGKNRVWRKTPPSFLRHLSAGEIKVEKVDDGQYKVRIIDREKMGKRPKSVWTGKTYDAASHGTKLIKKLFGDTPFSFPKSLHATEDVLYCISENEDGLILDCFGGSGTTAHAVIDLNRQDGGHRKYILIEMGDHFDTVLKPRVEKVVYSPDWKDGKPVTNEKGISHCFKYLRLESYEDALNNLEIDTAKGAAFAGLKDYFLKYMLEVETKGSPSLLRMGEIANPFGCKLMVKKPASEEREERVIDLVETFNYLIGLRVQHTAATRSYTAEFERLPDPELPEDGRTKLTIKGALKLDADGTWKFRTVEGWLPRNRFTPNDGAKDRVLIVWRTLTADREKDNAVLDSYLQRIQVSALAGDYDVIYVNGSNNVPNLRNDGDTWKVRSIEEDLQTRMWEGC